MSLSDNLPYEKVGKNEPVCIADEVPFEIPDSWEWARISTVFSLQAGKNIQASDISESDFDGAYLCYGGNGVRGYVKSYNREGNYPIIGRQGALCGNIKNAKGKFYATEHAVCVETFSQTNVEWACAFLEALNLNQYATATAQPGLAVANINTILIPIPPQNEQQRIVDVLSSLEPFIEFYAKKEYELNTLNQQFPNLLKKSILQEAVRGKLVPQDPADETASVLLERIRAEKEQLIKAGKIKRDKHESVIFRRDNSHYEKLDGIERCIDDKIPFEIPDSWAWTSVREVCSDIQYGSSQKSSPTGKVAVLRMGNLQNGRIVLDKLVYTSDPKEIEKYLLEYNDLLFNRTNSKELVGKVAIYKSEIPAIYAGYLVRMHPILIDSDYLNYVMQSQYYWIYCQNVRSDAIGQSNINAEKLKRFIFPLPPLEEQKRIVNEISHIIAKLKNL